MYFKQDLAKQFKKKFIQLSPMISLSFFQPYDYLSIMHYGQSDFAANEGDIVLQTTDPDFQSLIGNRGDMTATDIAELNTVYG